MRFGCLTVFILILLIIPFQAFSQDLSNLHVSGKGKFLPTESINKNVKDVYGRECAGLVIVSDLNGLSYGAYEGIVKSIQKPDDDLLYLAPNEKVITVYKSGYHPLTITLKDYDIRLSRGKVWQLQITGDNTVSGLIPVNIITNPADARVYIDNTPIDSSDSTQITHRLTPGKHTVKITRAGYDTLEKTIDVDSEQTFFPFSLKPKKLIPVEIESTPTDATIFLNGMNKGTTDEGFFLNPGNYKLTLSKDGYIDTTAQITVPAAGKKRIAFHLSQNVGYLHLNVKPAGANININDNDYNGRSNIALAPGSYQVNVSKLGYHARSGVANIAFDKTTELTFALKKEIGTLQFSIVPLKAYVELIKDGHVVKSWHGLNLIDSLQVGTYTFRALDPGYSDLVDSVLIQESKTSVKNLIMKRILSKENAGALIFNIQPPDADVELLRSGNLIKTWKGSNAISGLVPGNYEIISKKTGYSTSKKYLQLKADQQLAENVYLNTARDSLLTNADIQSRRIKSYANSFKNFESISLGLGNSYGNLGLKFEMQFDRIAFHIGLGSHIYIKSSDLRNHLLVAGGIKYIFFKSYSRNVGLDVYADAQYGSLADPIKAYGPSLLLGGTFWMGRHFGVTTSWGGSYDLGEVINSPRLIIGADLLGLTVKF